MASQDDKEKVGRIDESTLSLQNQLKLKAQINKAEKESLNIQKKLNVLSQQQARDAAAYSSVSTKINNLEQDILARRRNSANLTGRALAAEQRAIASRERALRTQQTIEKSLLQTVGGRIKAEQIANDKRRDALEAEKELIEDINKQRTVGQRFLDLFRSKEERQRRIDQARLKAGGGTNEGQPAAGGGELAAAGPYGAMAAGIIAAVDKMKAPFKALASAIKDGLTAPLSEAAAILGSDKVGIGGGKVSGAGATDMLGGLSKIASTIPFIGGLLGGLISGFKTLLDAVLGIDQANMNVARSMGISKKEAQEFRARMLEVADAQNNIVVNQTRLVESQLELGDAMGVTNQLSNSILENNVKLKDIIGLELGARKAIAESSTMTGKNADDITKNLVGQIGYLKQVTGISFKWQSILSEAGKLSGYLGLNFAKYPEKLTKTLLTVKALGFDLKGLNDQANSFLDFESSISKEFEAQVLTGKEMNLTKAREAALNNDLATLASEITKNVGSETAYLNMNRIQQDAIAESVGMTRDSLADVLKQQKILNALGEKDMKSAIERFNAVKNNGTERDKLIKKIGEENYAELEKVSIAEKLSAVMERIKQTFIAFIEKSKIFEFLTDEKKVNGFIRSIINGLAGAIDTVGDILASLIGAIGSLPFTDKAKWQGYADVIRSGASSFSSGITSIGGGVGLAEGGVVTQTGMAKVDKGEVYLGASSISVLKDQLDAQKETNKLLAALVNQRQSIRIDGREVAIANAENAGTIYQGQMS